jgi:LemA protein
MRVLKLSFVMVACASLTGCGYNRIQALDERAEELQSNVEVEMTNRNQLIPNLVATVEGAADFESGTFTEVAQARAGLTQAQGQVSEAVEEGDAGALSVADAQLTRQIGTYLNIAVEAYPQLRATESFMALQDQLAESENRISVARRDYNAAVAEFNTYIRQFPQVVTAKVVGAERKDSFEAPAGVETPPVVDFGG